MKKANSHAIAQATLVVIRDQEGCIDDVCFRGGVAVGFEFAVFFREGDRDTCLHEHLNPPDHAGPQ